MSILIPENFIFVLREKSMENFIVSARKYRPSTFKSVIGQPSITNTLKNAVKNDHLAHAYLFCGPRGVGKTTCARIFAKTLNCFNRTNDTEACNECESCKAFNDNRSYNIHELDAASNNSVDDIRNLIDQVRIPPQLGKYSIYIIDEVHMLSTSAFNAFLKTLEEPPSHAFFILATTEKHKIIPTILSRCQIFDFNRIKVEDTVGYLNYIAQTEGITVENDALHVVAQKADGGMRDALSIFDQIVSFSGKNITYKDVIENLNVLDYEYYFRMVDAFLSQSYPQALLLYDEILDKGFDGHIFINGLASHFRDLLVCKDEITLQLLEVSANIKEQYKAQSKKCSPYFLFEALNYCSRCDINFKASKNQRLHIELTLIQICNTEQEKKNSSLEAPTQIKSQQPTPVKAVSTPIKTAQSTPINTQQKPVASVSATSAFSLKNALKSDTKKEIITEPSNQPVNTIQEPIEPINAANQVTNFTSDQLNTALQKYSERLKENSPRLYSMLTTQSPELKENYLVEFCLSNPLQEDELQKIKFNLVNFLRAELLNNKIEICTTLSESQQSQRFYTDKEKFDHMAQKNPNLLKFKQQFGLDFG
jgi:DNA polymerase-3 subunit gamma/tau